MDLEIKLENKSGLTISQGKISTTSKNIALLGNEEIEMEPLLPFETRVYKVKLRGGDIFKTTQGEVTVKATAKSGDEKVILSKEKVVVAASFFSLGVQQILLVILIILLIIGIVFPKMQRGLKG